MTEADGPFDTPVVLVSFNRPDFARRVLDAVRTVRPTELFLVSDGPRHAGDVPLVEATRRVYDEVDWPCRVVRDFAPANLGCHLRIASGLVAAFERFPEAIVLEDDTVPHPDFFPFCRQLLARYRDEPRVMQIVGTRLSDAPYPSPHSYLFTQMSTAWGWASWRRAMAGFGPDDVGTPFTRWLDLRPRLRHWVSQATGIPGKLSQLLLGRHGWGGLDEDPALRARVEACGRFFTHGMKVAVTHRMSSWDLALAYRIVRLDGLVASPLTNLVTNVGFGARGTHASDPASRFGNRPVSGLEWPLRHPASIALDAEYQRLCARWYDEVSGYG